HRAAAIPSAVAHDVHLSREERIGVADDGADVEVVLPVLDRDVERMTARIEVGDDRLPSPVAVTVDDVTPVALAQQGRIEVIALGPRLRMRPGADLGHAPIVIRSAGRSTVAAAACRPAAAGVVV